MEKRGLTKTNNLFPYRKQLIQNYQLVTFSKRNAKPKFSF